MKPLLILPLLLFFIPAFGEELPKYSEPYSPIFTDKDVYSWTDKVNIMIVVPSWNANKAGIDTIGGDNENPISIATRGYELKPYKLSETELNSGIFVGEVILTGFEHDADGDGDIDTTPRTLGSGPTNGFLQTDRDGAITISFEFADGVVLTHSALINWNIGTIKFFGLQYFENESAVIRVTDFDMNLNPEAIDQVPIDVFSDSDSAGIEVDAIEINEDSGIFEVTISFSQTSESSGNRIFALPGDLISAEYEDNTLPSPYSQNDNLAITTTANLASSTPTLERVSLGNLQITDSIGTPLTELKTNNQLQIVGTVKNEQSFNQNVVVIFQITDKEGTVVSLSWVTGTLEKFQELNLSQSWNPQESGEYEIETFVWNSLQSSIPLTDSLSKSVLIQ